MEYRVSGEGSRRRPRRLTDRLAPDRRRLPREAEVPRQAAAPHRLQASRRSPLSHTKRNLEEDGSERSQGDTHRLWFA